MLESQLAFLKLVKSPTPCCYVPLAYKNLRRHSNSIFYLSHSLAVMQGSSCNVINWYCYQRTQEIILCLSLVSNEL